MDNAVFSAMAVVGYLLLVAGLFRAIRPLFPAAPPVVSKLAVPLTAEQYLPILYASSPSVHENVKFAQDSETRLLKLQERLHKEHRKYEASIAAAETTPRAAATASDTEQDEDEAQTVGEIVFKHDEPQRLSEYEGQRHLVKPLQLALRALAKDRRVLDHKLLTGIAGLGKTLLAKIIAAELRDRAAALGEPRLPFFETYAANLNGVAALDDVVRRLLASGGGVWFIDEIHVLTKDLATKLYLLMEDGRYPFEGSASPTAIPNVMLIGATTDYGMLHSALKRRFGEAMMLRAMSAEELRRMAPQLGFPIGTAAVNLLVSRCWQSGAPYELKLLFRECTIFATADGGTEITPAVVQDVLDTYEIDQHGLRPVDRSVISALFQRPRTRGKLQEFYCYGGSEQDICAVARLDRTEFQETIRPRLMSRSLLEVRTGVGLALTPLALTEYSALVPQ